MPKRVVNSLFRLATHRAADGRSIVGSLNGKISVEPLEGRVLFALPSGFAQTTFASGISEPTAMAFAPDGSGRLFVLEQGGAVKIVNSNGTINSNPFVTVPARNGGEQGLLGIAFAADFATSRHLYLHWITGTSQNRISRFTADASNPNVAAAGSQLDVLTLPQDPNFGYNHQGGAIGFGVDGKLYLTVGEHNTPSYAQNVESPFGKILRLNPDGTFPTDNPFYATSTGWGRAVWAMGLRNPYSFAIQPGTGRMLINDVGSNRFEEVNVGVAGANYGWPTTEGVFNNSTYPQFTNPVHAYERGVEGCAIIGGTFYNPPPGAANPFPAAYTGRYFFSDYCEAFVHSLDPAAGYAAAVFATDNQLAGGGVDLETGPDGSLYALARGGSVLKLTYTGSGAPSISTQPASQTVTAGQAVTFSVTATGAGTLGYQWQRNGTNIPGATSSSYTIGAVQASDDGATFRCVVTNASGSVASNAATLTVTSNQAPTATITSPSAGSLYGGGETIGFGGTGTDGEEGTLGGSAFTWSVVFHHDAHTHPHVAPFSGQTSGSFNVPANNETSPNVWYRVHLTVTDSQGLTHSTYRDVKPRTAQVTLATSPSGLSLDVDGATRATPHAFTGVAGITRTLGAPFTQTVGDVTYEFVSWSDGGVREHTISTPTSNTTYTATYRVVETGPIITSQPQSVGVSAGQPATFTVAATGSGTLSYQWQRNGSDIPGATAAIYTLSSSQLSDSGAAFRCVVTDSSGSATSIAATLTVATGAVPIATISAPAEATLYRGGDLIAFSGAATDAEDGTLPASAFRWEVLFHHVDHVHTAVVPFGGTAGGSFVVPTAGETSADVFYRIRLRVTDSDGLTHEVTRDVRPRTATVALESNVPGVQLTLDGQPVTAGHSFAGVAGVTRTIGAPASQVINGVVYDFVSWSGGDHGGHENVPGDHAVVTPDIDTTFTAVYRPHQEPDPRFDLAATIAGRLPPRVVGGNRGTAVILVRNDGTELLSGPVTVKVFMSADDVLGPGDAEAGVVTRQLALRPGGQRPVKMRLVYPAMPDGQYRLIAQVDPDNAVGEASDANNVTASAGLIANQAPVIDLSGSILSAPTALVRGRRGSVAVVVLNGGNVPARGPLTLSLFATTQPDGEGQAINLSSVSRPISLRGGSRKVVRIAFLPPDELAAGTYYFRVGIDSAETFTEPNEANNVLMPQGAFTIE